MRSNFDYDDGLNAVIRPVNDNPVILDIGLPDVRLCHDLRPLRIPDWCEAFQTAS